MVGGGDGERRPVNGGGDRRVHCRSRFQIRVLKRFLNQFRSTSRFAVQSAGRRRVRFRFRSASFGVFVGVCDAGCHGSSGYGHGESVFGRSSRDVRPNPEVPQAERPLQLCTGGIPPLNNYIGRSAYANLRSVSVYLRLVAVNLRLMSVNLRLVAVNRRLVWMNLRLVSSNQRSLSANLRLMSGNRRPVSVNRSLVWLNLGPGYTSSRPVFSNLRSVRQSLIYGAASTTCVDESFTCVAQLPSLTRVDRRTACAATGPSTTVAQWPRIAARLSVSCEHVRDTPATVGAAHHALQGVERAIRIRPAMPRGETHGAFRTGIRFGHGAGVDGDFDRDRPQDAYRHVGSGPVSDSSRTDRLPHMESAASRRRCYQGV